MKLRTGNILVAAALLFISMAPIATAQPKTNRPANWAQPMKVAGVKNCYQVSTNLYRGAQPTSIGFKNLKALGIKTIVNLREWHSDKAKMAGTCLQSDRFEMEPWHANKKEVIEFLKLAANTNNFPIFVHCERGADRTGMMCAMYRIAVCGWSKPQAIDEMKHGGFGYNPTWHELITFIEKADIADIKRRAGLVEK
jgi:protein tyrosine/serine phosphatase